MKKLIALLLCLLMLLGLFSAQAANEGVTGKIVIYTSMYQFVIDMMDAAMEEEFPNLDVEFFYGGTGALQQKLAGEIETGKLGCDMMLVAEPAYSLELKEGGWLHPYVIEGAQDLLRFPYDEEGYWYPVRVCNMVLAYNPELYQPEDLPKSFEGFAFDESLKGLISMGNPLTSGTTMASVAALSDLYGYEYFEALGKNNVMIESGSVALTKLETGECKAIMILEESVLKKRKEDGSKLAVIYPEDGVILIPSTVMSVAEDRSANMNVKAAEAITDWLLSEAGQKFVIAGYMHSVFKGSTDIPFDSIDTEELIAKDIGVDWVRTYTQRNEIQQAFQQAVTISK
ncbi:MAG TPA: ABC transporter substrate-binding protein [Clostridia bacterium]|jgi:iron(III) transport system substrate-binding protein|nr:ABC transporter substrate-binding protein [Clostridia bacterium]HPY44253.1 ABC transporter substrate-binding protein [Clostridia bacterium]HQA98526.1 ABC transporter substrate-binding protein [Clostridia bacterium]HQO55577.1 ABC transporter substrate-binding protein [Clostridia bacterium]